MKKRFFSKRQQMMLFCLCAVFVSQFMFAGSSGTTSIGTAAGRIKEYVPVIGTLSKSIGAVVGVIGGVRIYNKWSNGDQDINKELMGWGGACLFLILMPEFVAGILA